MTKGDMQPTTVQLAHNGDNAVFDLAAGGRLAQLTIGGRDLLVEAEPNPMGWGAYPMVPWAGRVADGRFDFAGTTHQLPITLMPHAIHGTGYVSSWTLDEATENTVSMHLDLVDPWPFGGRVEQRAHLNDGALRLELEVAALRVPMPAMAGWHPWFRRQIDGCASAVDLEFGPGKIWQLDDRAIPTGELIDAPPAPWDHCFAELEKDPVLRWGDELELRLTSNCSDWVIYTPDHAVCVEPQTSAPDSFNRSPDVIQPGESLLATFTIAWAASP